MFKFFLGYFNSRIELLRSHNIIGDRTINFIVFLKKINTMIRKAIKKIAGFTFNIKNATKENLTKHYKNNTKQDTQVKKETPTHTIETVLQKNIKRITKNHSYKEGSSDIISAIPLKLKEMKTKRR